MDPNPAQGTKRSAMEAFGPTVSRATSENAAGVVSQSALINSASMNSQILVGNVRKRAVVSGADIASIAEEPSMNQALVSLQNRNPELTGDVLRLPPKKISEEACRRYPNLWVKRSRRQRSRRPDTDQAPCFIGNLPTELIQQVFLVYPDPNFAAACHGLGEILSSSAIIGTAIRRVFHDEEFVETVGEEDWIRLKNLWLQKDFFSHEIVCTLIEENFDLYNSGHYGTEDGRTRRGPPNPWKGCVVPIRLLHAPFTPENELLLDTLVHNRNVPIKFSSPHVQSAGRDAMLECILTGNPLLHTLLGPPVFDYERNQASQSHKYMPYYYRDSGYLQDPNVPCHSADFLKITTEMLRSTLHHTYSAGRDGKATPRGNFLTALVLLQCLYSWTADLRDTQIWNMCSAMRDYGAWVMDFLRVLGSVREKIGMVCDGDNWINLNDGRTASELQDALMDGPVEYDAGENWRTNWVEVPNNREEAYPIRRTPEFVPFYDSEKNLQDYIKIPFEQRFDNNGRGDRREHGFNYNYTCPAVRILEIKIEEICRHIKECKSPIHYGV